MRPRNQVCLQDAPLYREWPLERSSRMVVTYAISCAWVDGRTPTLSTELSPVPIPIMVRPGASSSIDAAAHAATAGWRVNGLMTREPKRIRRVLVATKAWHTYTSRYRDCESAMPAI